MMAGETIIVLTGTPILDPYSNEPTGIDWTTTPPTEVPVEDVLCEPRPSSEPVLDARNSTTSGWTLYIRKRPVMPVITAADRVRVRGVDYDVLGEVTDWRLAALGGLVVQTSRTVG